MSAIEYKMLIGRVGFRIALHWLARWLLAVVLVQQFVLVAQACVLPLREASTLVMMAPCEEAGMGVAYCLIQCQKVADLMKPSVDVHFDALTTSDTWLAGLSIVPAGRMAVTASPVLQRCSGPPLQILFCSFQS